MIKTIHLACCIFYAFLLRISCSDKFDKSACCGRTSSKYKVKVVFERNPPKFESGAHSNLVSMYIASCAHAQCTFNYDRIFQTHTHTHTPKSNLLNHSTTNAYAPFDPMQCGNTRLARIQQVHQTNQSSVSIQDA